MFSEHAIIQALNNKISMSNYDSATFSIQINVVHFYPRANLIRTMKKINTCCIFELLKDII